MSGLLELLTPSHVVDIRHYVIVNVNIRLQ